MGFPMSDETTTGQILEILLDFRDVVGTRFDRIDAHLEAHDRRFDEHDRRFDAIDRRLAGLNRG